MDDLSRQEYPSILASLQPAKAVQILNGRLKHINKLNLDIADWLQERRRVEEAYVQGLRKLAARQFIEDSVELGIFSTPWEKIASSVEALAQSHSALARNINADVEQPLRDFANSNREMQAMTTITGNLHAIAKELDNAHKKADKLKEKGGKAAASKVASAASDVENAQGQWDSQAPYVFERLQEVDEIRCDNLRNVLTQYQTHVIEAVSAMSSSAEDCLNALLNVQSADEIKAFATKTTSGLPPPEPTRSRTETAPAPPGTSSSLAPTTSTPRHDDGSSQRSSSLQERPRSGFGGLKRLGTVIGRRKSTHPYGQSLSPEQKKSSSNLNSSTFSPFKRRAREKHATMDFTSPPSPNARRLSESVTRSGSQPSEPAASSQIERPSSAQPNGTIPEDVAEAGIGGGLVNGTQPSARSQLQEPLQPTVASSSSSQPPPIDSQGFSIPQSGSDAISQAEHEAALATENSQPQFKVDIRNAPIEEEDSEASAAMASVTTALRAQAAPRRSQGTLRGRRDRNTILVTNPSSIMPDLQPSETPTSPPTSAPLPAAPGSSSTPVQQSSITEPQQSPFKLTHRPTLTADEHPSSDTHSIRSGRSLASSASSTIKHPDMHEPGLNSSIVETVSAWFSEGTISKAAVIGEVALAYNPQDTSAPFGIDTIRLNNFDLLDKVAPNPAFIEPVPEKPGMYTVNLRDVTKTAVAFKYQMRLDESTMTSHTPLTLKSAWKIEPTQASVLVTYGMHPEFGGPLDGAKSVLLSNVVLMVHLDATGAKATSCKSMGGGIFSRERSLVYWRLGEVSLGKDEPSHTLKARFFTDGEAKAGNVEARWEITNEHMVGLGSGLSVGVLEDKAHGGSESTDPFADEEATPTVVTDWKDVRALRRLRSGNYVSSPS